MSMCPVICGFCNLNPTTGTIATNKPGAKLAHLRDCQTNTTHSAETQKQIKTLIEKITELDKTLNSCEKEQKVIAEQEDKARRQSWQNQSQGTWCFFFSLSFKFVF